MDAYDRLLARFRRIRPRRKPTTYEQRFRDMVRIQRAFWSMLRRSPEAYAQFIRRNFKARAVSRPITSRYHLKPGSDRVR